VPLATNAPQQTASLFDHIVSETYQKERPPRGGLSEIQSGVFVRRLLWVNGVEKVVGKRLLRNN
jgi:hypothetical protein